MSPDQFAIFGGIVGLVFGGAMAVVAYIERAEARRANDYSLLLLGEEKDLKRQIWELKKSLNLANSDKMKAEVNADAWERLASSRGDRLDEVLAILNRYAPELAALERRHKHAPKAMAAKIRALYAAAEPHLDPLSRDRELPEPVKPEVAQDSRGEIQWWNLENIEAPPEGCRFRVRGERWAEGMVTWDPSQISWFEPAGLNWCHYRPCWTYAVPLSVPLPQIGPDGCAVYED